MSNVASGEELRAQIARLARRLNACCRDHWWLIGSTALALKDGDAAAPADIDVLASQRDAEAFIALHAEQRAASHRPADDGRFRSTFARLRDTPLPVEIMGGLEVLQGDAWIPVVVADDLAVECAGTLVRLPTRCEQIRLFELFGRDKDLARAQALRARLAQEAAHAAFG